MKPIQRNYDGYRALRAAAERTTRWQRGVYSPVRCLDSAEQNANDTYNETVPRQYQMPIGREHTDQWQTMFWNSLESVLCFSEVSNEVRAWFSRRGIVA